MNERIEIVSDTEVRSGNVKVCENKYGSERVIFRYVTLGILEIDELGQIWRVKYRSKTGNHIPCERRRAEFLHSNGYWRIVMQVNYDRFDTQSHRVVWQSLHGDIPPELVINHINGIKTDNRPSNLELVTPSGNSSHAIALGLKVPLRGENHNCAKLTEGDVISIRKRRELGETLVSIAADFDVGMTTVSKICLRQKWRHVN